MGGREEGYPVYASHPTMVGIHLPVHASPVPPWVYHRLPVAPGTPTPVFSVSDNKALGSNLEIIGEKERLLRINLLKVLIIVCDDAQSCSVFPVRNIERLDSERVTSH